MKLWQQIGRVGFWVAWPGLWLVLHDSQRTRVMIMADGKMLVVKSWLGDGKWSLPGGGVHRGEKPRDASIREVEEETGIALKPLQLNRVAGYEYRENGVRFNYTLFKSSLKTTQQLHKQRYEIIDAAWIEPDQLSAHNAHQDVLTALKTLSTQ